MTVSCATLATQLAEAEAALHKLELGNKAEIVRAGEKQVSYTKSSIPDLTAYIARLQAAVDACNGIRRKGRAIRFMPVDC